MFWEIIGTILGGIGLFLLGVELMRNGFKEAAGNSLRRILSDFTDTTFKALISGFIVSSIVQSASAVTLTMIGFVNAHILRLRQAVTVVFGSNLGKITTAWIIALVGLKINITSVALPLIGVGIIAKMFMKKRHQGYAMALIGFSILFMGIGILKTSITSISPSIDLSSISNMGFIGNVLFFLLGFAMTVITQSSSVALAIALSATTAGIIPFYNAAEILVGLNLGTTSNTYLASMRTSPNAKRLAVAHILFNVMCTFTGVILVILLFGFNTDNPIATYIQSDPVIGLTAFYSVFILAGTILILPIESKLVSNLKRRFHQTSSLGSPSYINPVKDKNAPPLQALKVLQKEARRFGKISHDMLRDTLTWNIKNGWVYGLDLADKEAELDRLNEYIHKYASAYTKNSENDPIASRIQLICRSVQHFGLSSDLSDAASSFKNKLTEKIDNDTMDAIESWTSELEDVGENIRDVIKNGDISKIADIKARLEKLDETKRSLRYSLIQESVMGRMKSSQATALIDIIETSRRSIRELVKGATKLWKDHDVIENLSEHRVALDKMPAEFKPGNQTNILKLRNKKSRKD